ncbi:MAG: hydantoinase/oxoprolinase family protein [Gammaproteobacteria bacterium]|nr:hydantoinase/oxoprolinase family protein [Gammaproteobacteria bacterium]
MYRIGIDVGGTFTDLVAVDEKGHVAFAKHLTTPADQSVGLMRGLALIAEEMGTTRAALLAGTRVIIHGTTVATNALLEHKGSKVGMLITSGFRDVVTMREGLKPDRYNLRMPPQPVIVPRRLCLPVVERTRWDGSVEVALGEDSVCKAIAVLKSERVDAVAVCCLHAYTDASNERRIAEMLRNELPEAYVSLSSEVLPQIKEYERFSTTVVNAFVGPVLSNYLNRLRERLAGAGFTGEILIMQSHGGLATIEDAVRLGAGCVLSGPAGGIAAGRYAAGIMGVGDLITFDMGGTSSDIALLTGGEPHLSSDRTVEGTRIALPSIDIHTLGAGGGSIAHVEVGGLLKVGPQSAGADPGPACYGRGGRQAATTDANVVLGYYGADNFLGGRINHDRDAAHQVVDEIAVSLGAGTEDAAQGIVRVINAQMAEGVRVVATRAGRDPRAYALLSFGGAAGLHITDVARTLDIHRVIVPRPASVLSAWGMLTTDLRYELMRTAVGEIGRIGAERVRELFGEIEAEGRARVAGASEFTVGTEIHRSLDMRYGEQIFEINVPLDGIDILATDLVDQVRARFHQRHEELYTYCVPDQEVVLVNVRLSAVGVMRALPKEPAIEGGGAMQPTGSRRVYLDGWRAVPVYNMDAPQASAVLKGPAIAESRTTTILLRQGDGARVTSLGWLDIEVSPMRRRDRDGTGAS